MNDSTSIHTQELRSVIRIDPSSGDALRAMDAEALDFIPVVDDDGRLAGVALRPGIENGCWGMGHDPDRYRVRNHLKVDVATVSEGDTTSHNAQSRARAEPVVVVKGEMVPVGVLVPHHANPT